MSGLWLELGFVAWNEDEASFEICPCCGIEFGYDDMASGSTTLRQALYTRKRELWVKGGRTWWSTNPPPENWDPEKQLDNLYRQILRP